jgi:hypothetical protein
MAQDYKFFMIRRTKIIKFPRNFDKPMSMKRLSHTELDVVLLEWFNQKS